MKNLYNIIDSKVNKAILKKGHAKSFVSYSAYKTDKNNNPIDNLKDIPVKNKIILIKNINNWCDGKNYRSEILENPTWLEIAVCANDMIICTGDKHHCFLEGIKKCNTENNVDVYEFIMGS